MYSIINTKKNGERFNIKVAEFIIGEGFRADDGTWHCVIEDEKGLIKFRYCSTNRKKAVEGFIKQLIFQSYNNTLES